LLPLTREFTLPVADATTRRNPAAPTGVGVINAARGAQRRRDLKPDPVSVVPLVLAPTHPFARLADKSSAPERAAGYRLGLSVRGKDYEYDGADAGLANAPYPMKGVGLFTHANQRSAARDFRR
jgi:hypothetical protein